MRKNESKIRDQRSPRRKIDSSLGSYIFLQLNRDTIEKAIPSEIFTFAVRILLYIESSCVSYLLSAILDFLINLFLAIALLRVLCTTQSSDISNFIVPRGPEGDLTGEQITGACKIYSHSAFGN